MKLRGGQSPSDAGDLVTFSFQGNSWGCARISTDPSQGIVLLREKQLECVSLRPEDRSATLKGLVAGPQAQGPEESFQPCWRDSPWGGCFPKQGRRAQLCSPESSPQSGLEESA